MVMAHAWVTCYLREWLEHAIRDKDNDLRRRLDVFPVLHRAAICGRHCSFSPASPECGETVFSPVGDVGSAK